MALGLAARCANAESHAAHEYTNGLARRVQCPGVWTPQSVAEAAEIPGHKSRTENVATQSKLAPDAGALADRLCEYYKPLRVTVNRHNALTGSYDTLDTFSIPAVSGVAVSGVNIDDGDAWISFGHESELVIWDGACHVRPIALGNALSYLVEVVRDA